MIYHAFVSLLSSSEMVVAQCWKSKNAKKPSFRFSSFNDSHSFFVRLIYQLQCNNNPWDIFSAKKYYLRCNECRVNSLTIYGNYQNTIRYYPEFIHGFTYQKDSMFQRCSSRQENWPTTTAISTQVIMPCLPFTRCVISLNITQTRIKIVENNTFMYFGLRQIASIHRSVPEMITITKGQLLICINSLLFTRMCLQQEKFWLTMTNLLSKEISFLYPDYDKINRLGSLIY